MSSYWRDQASKIPNADALQLHPWYAIVEQTLADSNSELESDLRRARELEAYCICKTAIAIEEAAALQKSGMDESTAREVAFDKLIPGNDISPVAPEDEEGAEEDAAWGVMEWLENRDL